MEELQDRERGIRRPHNRQPTVKDVAALAKVHSCTVSRVLNGAKGTNVTISSETRKRVEDAAAILGYQPNPFARDFRLRRSESRLVGFIARGVRTPFFPNLLDALMLEAEKRRNYNAIVSTTYSDARPSTEPRTTLETRRCDALIIIGDALDDHLDNMAGSLPSVWLCQGSRGSRPRVVNTDNKLGISLAFEYLQNLGHRRISYIGHGGWSDEEEREAAFAELVKMNQYPMSQLSIHKVVGGLDTREKLFQQVEAILTALFALTDPPTAIVASTDEIAIALLKVASVHGIGIPKELSITGFDDIDFSEFTIPSLTTIRQPVELMAEATFDLLEEALSGVNMENRRRVVEPQLVIRESCASPSA